MVFFGVLGLGCSLAPSPPVPKENPKEAPVKKKQTLGQLLKSQIAELQAENRELKETVAKLEEQQAQSNSGSGRVESLEKTIALLERNIIDIKQKLETAVPAESPLPSEGKPKVEAPPPSQSPAELESPLPQSPIETDGNGSKPISTGIIKEIETPEKSKAIETVSLIPSVKESGQKNNAESGKVAGPQETKPLPSTEKKGEESWEDPDLTPPLSPIRLTVMPGAKRHYQNAFKSFTKKSYLSAAQEFEQFIRRFPNDQDADNSQFWIGQCLYRTGNFLEAERAFRKVLKNYAHGDTVRGYKTPDAVLMLGRIYLKRDKPIKARSYFEHILANFPDSQSAGKARREIQAMNSF